jgi:hypothetical protein
MTLSEAKPLLGQFSSRLSPRMPLPMGRFADCRSCGEDPVFVEETTWQGEETRSGGLISCATLTNQACPNDGALGMDGVTFEQLEAAGLERADPVGYIGASRCDG